MLDMNIESFRIYCLQKAGTEECFPFDESTLVFKVMGKMFALSGLNRIPCQVNLKCDPERAIQLREEHHQVIEGYHMSKKHWNTVSIEEGLNDALIKEMIDHSYDLVVSKLTKKIKAELQELKDAG